MKKYLVYGANKIPYTIITNEKLKNLTITISQDKGVVVKNPGYPLYKVENFVLQKALWIEKKLSFISTVIKIQKLYETEKKVLLNGEKIPLHVKDLNKFYLAEAKKIVPPLVHSWAEKMQVSCKNIRFRKTKRRWGSCNSKDEISFNPSMIQLPLKTMEYLIVHELAHIKHKHHQKSFWQFIHKHMPDYKYHEKCIKHYSPEI